MKELTIFIFSLGIASGAYCQGEFNHWFFGDHAGIHFSQDTGVSDLPNSQMFAKEGSSSISDKHGNLLFYSDGIEIYDRNHQVMLNGSGLKGGWSSTQTSKIVKNPCNDDLYYFFTVDGEDNLGLNYSVVDMALNNGLGDVTNEKNILLTDGTTEKIEAIAADETDEFWICTTLKNSSTAVAYKFDCQGYDSTYVESNIQTRATSVGMVGAMKFSHESGLCAIAYYAKGLVEVCSFDKSNGTFTSLFRIPVERGTMGTPYGVEFSPDANLLYITDFHPSSSVLYQVDISQLDSIAAIQSLIGLDTISGGHFGALQIGPDNKIYIANTSTNKLGIVSMPNNPGIGCNFDPNGFSLTGLSWEGLPSEPLILDKTASVFRNVENKKVLLFPNPVMGNSLHIQGVIWNHCEIIDPLGNFFKVKMIQQNEINMDEIPSGAYILRLYGPNEVYISKFIRK